MRKTIQLLAGILAFSFLAILNSQAQPTHNLLPISEIDNDYLVASNVVEAPQHCEIPCGIFKDKMRIDLLNEHITTIEKSMNLINKLSNEKTINYNQLVRWIANKDEHANKMQEIVSQYFLHQRVKIKKSADKEAYKKYMQQLEALHHISVYAMKTKQSTDLGLIKTLQDNVTAFEHLYFDAHHGHKH
ncbi:MAG TPA: superoxide dismutase [Flavobacteriaceae bacterium]|nr:superoxide dismutase [Flavobacteriaceae bacterium]